MTDTDRELLELAAKAAGLDRGYLLPGSDDPDYRPWNPLTDDGDALRLAVKLDLELYRGDNDGPSVFVGYWGKAERRDVSRLYCIQHVGDDLYAATRRAIVRAAAEIGRSMP